MATTEPALSIDHAELLLAEIQRLQKEVETLRQRERELDVLAHRDALVDMPNRRCFVANLERLIARVERYGDPAAMVFVDVDGLKRINDRFGHGTGDAALQQIAHELDESVRTSDCVARLGGDEFGILLEHADELTAWRTALRVVEAVMAADFKVDSTAVCLSVAVGPTVIQAGDTPQTVMDRADRQMYRVKAV